MALVGTASLIVCSDINYFLRVFVPPSVSRPESGTLLFLEAPCNRNGMLAAAMSLRSAAFV